MDNKTKSFLLTLKVPRSYDVPLGKVFTRVIHGQSFDDAFKAWKKDPDAPLGDKTEIYFNEIGRFAPGQGEGNA